MILQHRSSETYTYTEAHVGAGENFSVCEKKNTGQSLVFRSCILLKNAEWRHLATDIVQGNTAAASCTVNTSFCETWLLR